MAKKTKNISIGEETLLKKVITLESRVNELEAKLKNASGTVPAGNLNIGETFRTSPEGPEYTVLDVEDVAEIDSVDYVWCYTKDHELNTIAVDRLVYKV